MEIKDTLKAIKMNESKISAILGGLVILVVAIMVVNYFRNLRPGDTTPPGISTEQPTSTPGIIMHKVERGESLWTIAEKYYNDGYKWTEIRDANKLTNSDNLASGQELIVPNVQASPVAQVSPTPTVSATPLATIAPTASPIAQPEQPIVKPSEGQITGDKYTVQAGDSLWEIAQRAYNDGNKWPEIAKANKLANPNIIHSGNNFTLPR